MKFTEVTFTHPRVVFQRGAGGAGSGTSVGYLSTKHSEVALRVESIELVGPALVVKRPLMVRDESTGLMKAQGTETRVVPFSAVENATPVEGK